MRRVFSHVWVITGTLLLANCTQTPKPELLPAVASVVPQSPVSRPQLPTPPKPERDLVTDPSAIMAAQRTLIQLGYTLGKPDGVLGPATQKAIKAFQKDHHLAEDERLTFAIAEKLKALVEVPSALVINARAGDMLVYSDGETEVITTKHTVQWGGDNDGDRSLVAIRPGTNSWPAAARAGLEWALTHALDSPVDGPDIKWSSTGVSEHFQIRTSSLSPREAELVGGAPDSCRRFDMRVEDIQLRYPGIACRDAKNQWYIPHSTIRLRRPVTALGQQRSIMSLPTVK
jgi:peptidoglycan hydrolase-like protein with peptidoglycan-binding domain